MMDEAGAEADLQKKKSKNENNYGNDIKTTI